ncbi:sugar ABC transporter permease [Thermoflexus sp.]|uniref:sugar ABC transporter permease n=1 Tax=Thermoflexus sp. TaxID=1969742 RepID=UPI002994745D|nr:sugar ABC transporter permease [Thermoflexus sp.]MDW8185974.1 sugar ABC transporter permease [Anaerolineae bacterium]
MMERRLTSSVVEASAAPARPWPRLQWRALFYRPRGDSPFKRLLIHAALWVACLIAVYPVLRVVTISLRPANKLLTTSLAIIPEDATLNNYIELLVGRPGRPTDFYLWIWNSLIITLTTATVGLLLSATAAYAFSRFRFPGRSAGLIFLLSTQMFPAAMLLLPLFIMISRLGLINSYLGLVIAYSVTAVPFSIWMLKGYYDTIPRDLEEAAMIDGASRLGVLWHIIRPLSTPALGIAFLFNFMTSWNEYIVARIILNKREMYTWPLGLWTFTEQYTVLWGKFAAASILVAVPVTLLFLYSSRWLLSGLTLGGVKE